MRVLFAFLFLLECLAGVGTAAAYGPSAETHVKRAPLALPASVRMSTTTITSGVRLPIAPFADVFVPSNCSAFRTQMRRERAIDAGFSRASVSRWQQQSWPLLC